MDHPEDLTTHDVVRGAEGIGQVDNGNQSQQQQQQQTDENVSPMSSTEQGRVNRARKRLLDQQHSRESEEQLDPDSTGTLTPADDTNTTSPSRSQIMNAAERTREWSAGQLMLNPTVVKKEKPKSPAKMRRLQASNSSEPNDQPVPENIEMLNTHDHYLTMNYNYYEKNITAHVQFNKKFNKNPFGYSCAVCERLWFKKDLKVASEEYADILREITNIEDVSGIMICGACRMDLNRRKIPFFSTYNGFQFPIIPSNLPKLDSLSERLVSLCFPFKQIRRLSRIHGQDGIYGQIINIPITVNSMVNKLPRNIDDDHCITVDIEKKKLYKPNYLHGLINKEDIKVWVEFLVETPLHEMYDVTIEESLLEDSKTIDAPSIKELTKDISIEENLIVQQQTLLWEDKTLSIFDENVEELLFPMIYLGQLREFREDIKITPFMIASSEIRRRDRRGVTPSHLLYVAMKIMRMRIRKSLSVTAKNIGPSRSITRQKIESKQYIKDCMKTNFSFLRAIPNSAWHWIQQKEDLFAIIRQKGKPTACMTLNANEMGWPKLIRLLRRLTSTAGISNHLNMKLNSIQKATLINNDAVTSSIYFIKLVNVILDILQSKEYSPFGRHRVIHYFKRIEFQKHGSPRAKFFLWLDNAPEDYFAEDNKDVITFIDSLVSVLDSDTSGSTEHQNHKHTSTCSKKTNLRNQPSICTSGFPFMPCEKTMILSPMPKIGPYYQNFYERYCDIKSDLRVNHYNNIEDFYEENNVKSHDDYYRILRAGISRPQIFYKRAPHEKDNIPFNPYVLNVFKGPMEFQLITDEHSCATHIAEYLARTDRGISDLRTKIIELINDNPESDITEIIKQMSVDMIKSVELTSQEAAWYLLRQPMSETSVTVCYIDTVRPAERQRIKKPQEDLNDLEDDSKDIWREDWYAKYQNRPEHLEHITLAQFVSRFYKNENDVYMEIQDPYVIRYHNYSIASDCDDYKREMVTLHVPFRDEETDILADRKYINIYNNNESLIVERRREFESSLDIQKTIEICRQMCLENDGEMETQDTWHYVPETNQFDDLNNDTHSETSETELELASSDESTSIELNEVRIAFEDKHQLTISSGEDPENDIVLQVIRDLHASSSPLVQRFLTAPASCGELFIIKLIMIVYDRFSGGNYDNVIGEIEMYRKLEDTLLKFISLPAKTPNKYFSFLCLIGIPIDSLSNESRRLMLNRIQTVEGIIMEFVNSRRETHVTSDCQSHRRPFRNTNVSAFNVGSVLLLKKTLLDNVDIDVSNFNCIVRFKKYNSQIPQIAVHRDSDQIRKVITESMEILLRNAEEIEVGHSAVGDICAAQCVMGNGRKIVMAVVYIYPNNSMENIIKFLNKQLISFMPTGSETLGGICRKLPLVLSGDFNVDLKSDQARPLIYYLYYNLQLSVSDDGTFFRYLEDWDCPPYIAYFGYHRSVTFSRQH